MNPAGVRSLGPRILVVAFVLAASSDGAHPVSALARSATTLACSASQEKASRTPAQRKINSQLLQEIRRRRADANEKFVPEGKTIVKVDEKGRALVDVRADVTAELENKLRSLGGTIVSTSRPYRSIIAWVPLLELEPFAEDPAVRAIEPAAQAITAR